MSYLDLHCHWLVARDAQGGFAQLDDGARTLDDARAMLQGLADLGFELSHATPHMRPGMFDLDKPRIERAYQECCTALGPLPLRTALACEHFFDDVVATRIVQGAAVPFPKLPTAPHGLSAILIEFPRERFPLQVALHFQRLIQRGYLPVLAHPERYRPVWEDDRCLDPFLDAGVALLLDACAVTGKYGKAAAAAATKLLEDGAYQAACSDAHRPGDLDELARAMIKLDALVGRAERDRLFDQGPRSILAGRSS